VGGGQPKKTIGVNTLKGEGRDQIEETGSSEQSLEGPVVKERAWPEESEGSTLGLDQRITE